VLKGKVIEKMAAPQRQAEALAAYSTALKLNPGSVTCIVSKSEMLVALLRHKEAIALLQQAARANSCPLLLLALGRVLSGTGRYMEALDQLQLCAALAEGTLEGNEASEEIDRVESQLAAMREEEEAGGFEHEEQEETNFVIGSSDIL
jgi:tetratricopeptide (TPR) repeat protein